MAGGTPSVRDGKREQSCRPVQPRPASPRPRLRARGLGTCVRRGRGRDHTHAHPHPTPWPPRACAARFTPISPLRRARAARQRARARRGCRGDRGARPGSLAAPLPACSLAGVFLTGEGRRLSTRNIPECCVAVKPISPEETETRARSSASVGNQCSTSATGRLRTTAAQVQSLCSSTLKVPTKHPSAGSSPPCT